MENYKQKIEDVLNQAVTEKTFSLEIIEKIKSLKDGFDASQEQLEQYKKEVVSNSKTIEDLRTAVSGLNIKVSDFEKRELDLSTKEKIAEKTIYELEFQKKRAEEIKELFGIVFRNPVVRKSVYENGSNQTGYTTNNITEDIVEE